MTCSLGVLTIVMCAGLYFLPSIKEGLVVAAITGLDGTGEETTIEIEEVVLDKEELNIELPEHIQGQDVEIINDYVNHTIYVQFAQGVENYSDNYVVRGSSNHIANLSYYKEGDAGVLEINLDKACEYSYSYKSNFLCMKIMDLHDVYEKVVVIDAGHGGKKPGAVKKDIKEKTINLDIVLKIKELLDQVDEKKVKVFYTRLEDENPSLAERVDMANKLDADLFISIHNNASGSGTFTGENGTLVMYSQDDTGELTSKELAQICLDNVTASAGSKNMGLLRGDHIYIIKNSEVPVALIEVGYMSNTTELNKLIDPEYQRQVAEGVYNAIMQAFEEGF